MASLCGSAFGYGNFPGVESSMALDRLEQRFATSVEQAVNSKLAEALERKVEVRLVQRRDGDRCGHSLWLPLAST